MSDIQSLTLRVQDLSQSTDWWNTAVICALVFVALAAIAVVITTLIALRRAKQLADTQAELTQAKDKQLVLALKDKDVKIAEAAEKAATAEKTAEGFRLDIAKANERAAEANRIAEGERLARAKIEERLADRTLTDQQIAVIAAALKPFSGQEYGITAYRDLKESVSIANRIHTALLQAGWIYLKPERFEALLGGVAGVFVYVHPDADEKTKKAADALLSTLLKEGIAAQLRQENPVNNPKHNKIDLNIGSKP